MLPAPSRRGRRRFLFDPEAELNAQREPRANTSFRTLRFIAYPGMKAELQNIFERNICNYGITEYSDGKKDAGLRERVSAETEVKSYIPLKIQT